MSWYGDAYRSAKNTLFPDRPKDLTTTPAYTGEQDFATGLGTQRSNFSPTATPTISEAPPPGAAGRIGGGNVDGAPIGGANRSQNIYADPTGANAQKNALTLDQQAAEGKTPSAAEMLYRKGTDEGIQDQLNLAATTQGSNPGMSQRAGLAGAAHVANANAAGAGALRASEMATGREQYGTEANNTRGQTLDEAKANQTANIQQQLANNQFYLGLTDEQQKALVAMLGGAQANATNQQNWASGNQALVGGLLGTGGKIAAS